MAMQRVSNATGGSIDESRKPQTSESETRGRSRSKRTKQRAGTTGAAKDGGREVLETWQGTQEARRITWELQRYKSQTVDALYQEPLSERSETAKTKDHTIGGAPGGGPRHDAEDKGATTPEHAAHITVGRCSENLC